MSAASAPGDRRAAAAAVPDEVADELIVHGSALADRLDEPPFDFARPADPRQVGAAGHERTSQVW